MSIFRGASHRHWGHFLVSQLFARRRRAVTARWRVAFFTAQSHSIEPEVDGGRGALKFGSEFSQSSVRFLVKKRSQAGLDGIGQQ